MSKTVTLCKKIPLVVIIIILCGLSFLQSFTNNLYTGAYAERSKAEFYSLEINATNTERTTDGKNPVEYVLTVTNTGNRVDTFTFYVSIIEVTNCDEPDINEWSYNLDVTLLTLQPAESAPIVLTISSSCGCQVGCKANIAVNGISGGDPSVRKAISTYTTRGPAKKVSGLVVEIDYNYVLNVLYLDTTLSFDVYIYNLQNQQDSIIVWPTKGPREWSITVTPEEFTMMPNSKRMITLSFKIPANISNAIYTIELTAQSIDSPSLQGKDRIEIHIKPDIMIKNAVFSKTKINSGDEVKIRITVQNIGLGTASNIPIIIYDELNITSEHEISKQTIELLEPNRTTDLNIVWQPINGNYNITIWLNPNSTLDELRRDNNLRIEPITVGKALEQDADDLSFYLTFLLIFILIIVWLVIYYKFSKRRNKPGEPETKNMTKPNLPKNYKRRIQG